MIWLQLLAMGSMLTDHIGAVFFPDVTEFRLVGRLAFPLYAAMIGVGIACTRSLRDYGFRLAWLAFIASYAQAFMLGDPSRWMVCVWGFAASVALVGILRIPTGCWRHPLVAVVIVTTWVLVDYGVYTLLIPLAMVGVVSITGRRRLRSGCRLPRWLWYWFYPAHMALLGLGRVFLE